MTVLYLINLRGGGGDIACADCLPEARRHHERNVAIVSVAPIDSAADECGWCGAPQTPAPDR